MIFSNQQRGQTTIEAMGTIVIIFLILVPGIIIMLHGLCSLILTSWASRTSHCVAQSGFQAHPQDECIRDSIRSLTEHFAFRDVHIRVRTFRGIIHTEIQAHLLQQSFMGKYNGYSLLKSSYDLEPSEYKRVK